MSKPSLKIIILFVLLSFLSAHIITGSNKDAQIIPQSVKIDFESLSQRSPESQKLNGDDGLLQFTSGGHILGFKRGEMFVASADHALRVEFVNARSVAPIETFMNAKSSRQAAKPLGQVAYGNLWDRVTLIYEKNASGVVKSTYYIEPAKAGAVNPVEQIRLRYNAPVKIDAGGNVVFSFATGEMRESRPIAWQETGGKKVPVDVGFRSIGEQEVGFNAAPYDPRFPLTIDPLLSWMTFLGGSGFDLGDSIAVDNNGNTYITGSSGSTWGSPLNPFSGGDADVFVAKLNASGALQWNTFLGGSNMDSGSSISVDGSGNIYVVGGSNSSWGSPIRPFSGGVRDAFAAKLSSSGALEWNTFLGGSSDDFGAGISVEDSGNIYVTGDSDYTWGSPIRPFSGGNNAFVAKLNTSGTLLWNTFLGGYVDGGLGISVDGSGKIYVTGVSYSAWGNPLNHFSGLDDAFVAKLSTSGALQWNTFLGGSYGDLGKRISADGSGNICVMGCSSSTWASPLNHFSGGGDTFVAKLNSSGALLWNTFLGGSGDDQGYGMSVDGNGNIYVTGESSSTWGSPLNPFKGGNDAFVAKLNASGTLNWNTFRGGSSADSGRGISADGSGNIYVTGYSSSTWGSPLNPFKGGNDAFVAKLSSYGVSFSLRGSPSSVTVTAGQSATYTITVTPEGGSFNSAISFSCKELPGKCTASFSPGSVTPGASAVTTTLTLATQAKSGSASQVTFGSTSSVPPALGLLLAIVVPFLWSNFRKAVRNETLRRWLAAGIFVCLILLIASCGTKSENNGGGTGTPAGTYQVSVTGQSGSLMDSTTVTLVVR